MTTIDWPQPRRRRGRGRYVLLGLFVLLFLFGSTALSYYVDGLWFESLGFQSTIFTSFAAVTFLVLYGSFLALKPGQIADLASPILINGQPLRLPVEPVLRLIGGGVAAFVAIVTG